MQSYLGAARAALSCAACGVAFSLVACGAAEQPGVGIVPLPLEPAPVEMLRVSGTELVDGTGQPVVLRGVAFGNQVYTGVRVPPRHHDVRDYRELRAVGLNSVRFYMNYLTFEEDREPFAYKQEGWDWLDKNVAWAKENGVYLVLNMHVPVGGYQSLGRGAELWSSPEVQDRFVALWKAIAARYRMEVTIAGYDLLNEPVPTHSIDQWKDLAERTIAAIREVDPYHPIFVERVNAVGGDWSEDADRNFFRVSDPNVVYEFHFYKPFHFTHQGAPWTEFAALEGKYPDPLVAEVDWFQLEFVRSVRSPKLPPGDSDWAEFVTPSFVVEEGVDVGKPVLVCDHNPGRAWFDELTLERVDEAGSVLEKLWERDLDTRRGWFFWTRDGSGKAVVRAEGHGDETALALEGTRSLANLGSDPLRFIPERGARYRLRGFMKGKGISASSECAVGIDLFSSRVPVLPRGKEYIRQELEGYLAWGEREGVPLYLGEFGTIRKSFEEGRGGAKWVADVLDVALERDLGFAYHAYHETYFAWYYGEEWPDPAQANHELIELFSRKLAGEESEDEATPSSTEEPSVNEPSSGEPGPGVRK